MYSGRKAETEVYSSVKKRAEILMIEHTVRYLHRLCIMRLAVCVSLCVYLSAANLANYWTNHPNMLCALL